MITPKTTIPLQYFFLINKLRTLQIQTDVIFVLKLILNI